MPSKQDKALMFLVIPTFLVAIIIGLLAYYSIIDYSKEFVLSFIVIAIFIVSWVIINRHFKGSKNLPS
jgi:ABC-type dipeptide/oligopeptide/nickel transport system permease subunit